MKVEQIAELVNDVTQEVIGTTAVLQEDLCNVVDFGKEVADAVDGAYDNYVRSLIDHIGKVVFVDRPYAGKVPSVLKDAWTYGSVLEKISMELPEVSDNDAWKLEAGETYNQDVFYKPVVTAKFYNSKTTFELPISITTEQVEEAFSSANQLNAFISMIFNTIEKALTIAFDGLIMRTINAMIARTAIDAKDTTYVDLSDLYYVVSGSTISASTALQDPDFIKFASYTIKLYSSRMQNVSTLFNTDGKIRFTPKDKLHIVLLDEFASASEVYLESDTFHNDLVSLPKAETVPFWQGSGKSYKFSDASYIDVDVDGNRVKAPYVIGVMFDDEAVAVCNSKRKVNTHFNAKGDFMNYYYKAEASYLADTSENFVVFTIGQPTITTHSD